jgi:hypothetical protein
MALVYLLYRDRRGIGGCCELVLILRMKGSLTGFPNSNYANLPPRAD